MNASRVVFKGLPKYPWRSRPLHSSQRPWQALSTCSSALHIPMASSSCRPAFSFDRRLHPASTNACIRPPCRCFSTNPSPSLEISNLRNFVKPFLLRCHPDLQNTPDTKQVNLKAIQNLNGFLDNMEGLAGGGRPQPSQNSIVEIDFIIAVDNHSGSKRHHKAASSLSRRKVQLSWPYADVQDQPGHLVQHVSRELGKLLRVAGLDVPVELIKKENSSPWEDETAAEDGLDYKHDVWAEAMGIGFVNGPRKQSGMNSMYARAAAARRRFTRSVDWEKVNTMYRQAWEDAQADIATEGLLKNSRERRLRFISNILSRVVPDDDINLLDRFCAMRRLSMLFEEHFERLELEECSAMWERVTIQLSRARDYNTNPSAMHKRRMKEADTGFAFTLHADGRVSMQIPIDYRDEELLEEWERNHWDFYDMMSMDLDDIFLTPKAGTAHS